MSVVLPGSQVVLPPPVAEQRGCDVTALFLQHSDNAVHSTSPVSLRAAFASSPRYHHNTCPANLATAERDCIVSCHRRVTKLSASPLPAAADALVFDAPELAEETLLDVRHFSTYLLQ